MPVTVTDVVAWIGGLTGTASLVWDVIKWRASGPSLVLSINPDMRAVGPHATDARFLMVRAYNRGSAATTVMALSFEYWSSPLAKAMGRKPSAFLVTGTTPVPTPARLDPGGEWTSIVPSNENLEAARNGGVLMCCVHHSMSDKASRARVVFRPAA